MTTGHAVIWSGPSYSTLTDLHPASGFKDSVVQATDGIHQVGVGEDESVNPVLEHALLWSGTAASVVDLNPAGFTFSIADGLVGDEQIGWGLTPGGSEHALLWRGTAASVVDLNQYLPSNLVQAYALGIDASGNIYGWAAEADGVGHAVIWTPVPEPLTLPLLGLLAMAVTGPRTRRASRSPASSGMPQEISGATRRTC